MSDADDSVREDELDPFAPRSSKLGWLKGGVILLLLIALFIPMLVTRNSAEETAIANLHRDLKAEVIRVELPRAHEHTGGRLGREILFPAESDLTAGALESAMPNLEMLEILAITATEQKIERKHLELWQALPQVRRLSLLDCKVDYDSIGLLGQYPQLDEVNLTGSGVSAEIVFEMQQRSPKLKVISDLPEEATTAIPASGKALAAGNTQY